MPIYSVHTVSLCWNKCHFWVRVVVVVVAVVFEYYFSMIFRYLFRSLVIIYGNSNDSQRHGTEFRRDNHSKKEIYVDQHGLFVVRPFVNCKFE